MFADQKAQELSLALIKISVYARRPEFRHRLEKLAFQALEEVAARDFQAISRTITVLEGLVRFGKTIYEIEPVNADMLIQEIGNLNSAIRQIAELSLPDLEKLPNSEQLVPQNQTLFERRETKAVKHSRKSGLAARDLARPDKSAKANNPAIAGENAAIAESGKSDNSAIAESAKISSETTPLLDDNPAIRQSAIVEKIRQFGNEPAKLKDIIAAFPDYSERTLRYDLERLCSLGVIERVGTGGPATYYKIRVI